MKARIKIILLCEMIKTWEYIAKKYRTILLRNNIEIPENVLSEYDRLESCINALDKLATMSDEELAEKWGGEDES